MDVFALRERVISEYRNYVEGFIAVKEPDVRAFVQQYFDDQNLWPEPLVQLNPAFEPIGEDEKLSMGGGIGYGNESRRGPTRRRHSPRRNHRRIDP